VWRSSQAPEGMEPQSEESGPCSCDHCRHHPLFSRRKGPLVIWGIQFLCSEGLCLTLPGTLEPEYGPDASPVTTDTDRIVYQTEAEAGPQHQPNRRKEQSGKSGTLPPRLPTLSPVTFSSHHSMLAFNFRICNTFMLTCLKIKNSCDKT